MRRSEVTPKAKPRAELEELAYRIRRLVPDHRDPHRFHEEKSEIAFELAQLAQRVQA